MHDRSKRWRLDLGANVLPDEGVHFRVWAPTCRSVDVQIESDVGPRHQPMAREESGYFVATVSGIGAGARYRYRLDGGQAFPDPCSRYQPEGPHGPSQVVDPSAYRWRDEGWTGVGPDGLVIYELHVGTFTQAGTFDAVIPELPELKRLGVTAIEVMPVAEFPGRRNWGYDGVDLYAPSSAYGGPERLRQLVDAAHQVGLGVLLDVVYNHFGPDGNYLRLFANDYFTDRHHTPWGDAVNYDGPNSAPVRHFVLQNVRYWLEEYHLDGLRLDATHAIVDDSPRHLLEEIAEVAHSLPGRRTVAIAEDHRNDVRLLRSAESGGYGLDGVWADDFHHALRTYLTGERDGYYGDYSGSLEDVARVLEGGFLYQGQTSPTKGKPRGTIVTGEPASAFVICTENHDQVGNRAFGERLAHLIDRERYVLASAVLLVAPETPLLFQGQEFAASSPFLYFTDHNPELGRLVTEGRRKEFAGFSAFVDPKRRERIPDPQAEQTFDRSRLDLGERERHADVYRTYQMLLGLRRDDPVLRSQDRAATRAAAVGERLLLVHRWNGSAHRLLVANFGDAAVQADPHALGLPATSGWRPLWTSPNVDAIRQPIDLAAHELSPRSGLLVALDAPDQEQASGIDAEIARMGRDPDYRCEAATIMAELGHADDELSRTMAADHGDYPYDDAERAALLDATR